MAIPAQSLFKLMTSTTSPSDLMRFTSSISTEATMLNKPTSQFSMKGLKNDGSISFPMSPDKSLSNLSTSPSSASKRNKRKSLEPKKVNTLDMEGNNLNNNGMVRKLDFDAGSSNSLAPSSLSVTRLFESSSPSGNSQKSDISVDSGNSSSCCRSPSPDSLSPKRSRTSTAPPKKRFKEDPTLNLVLSDCKETSIKNVFANNKKTINPFRPWGDCNKDVEEEEINDDEDESFVDVERHSPIPTLQNARPYGEISLESSSSLSSGNPKKLSDNKTLPPLPMIPAITPQLITANHQQLVQASQNLLALSKLYPSLVDMNTLASVAAAAQLAASTAAAAAVATGTSSIPPLQPQMMNQGAQQTSPHRPHLAGIQDQYSSTGNLKRVEPEQEEPLALIKKPNFKSEPISSNSIQPINYSLTKKIASLKENHQPSNPKGPDTTPSSLKKDNKKSPTSNNEKNTQQQRNYKNMTRERRVEANARERQRVHTITAAFDTLQSLIPAPEDVMDTSSKSSSASDDGNATNPLSNLANQKLSKLSIIKIATAYIMLLSRMAGYDYSEDKSAPSIEDCVKKCSELLTQETKVKRSRDTIIKMENTA